MLWLLGIGSIYFLNNFWVYFFPKVSVRGIFLNFIWCKLNKSHKKFSKKEKNPYGIFIVNYFSDSSFLQLAGFM